MTARYFVKCLGLRSFRGVKHSGIFQSSDEQEPDRKTRVDTTRGASAEACEYPVGKNPPDYGRVVGKVGRA